ncbi:MAG: hypothetical protein K6E95_01245 [Lachnospiraceae bacterium]|nr:hypothetical protein [Lachnospiraceae bacterium]
MSESRGKKKLIIIICSIVGVLGILASVYLINRDSIDNWLRIRFMNDEEYAEAVSENFVSVLRDGAFAPTKYVPDISKGTEYDLSCILDQSVATLIGIPRTLKINVYGNAYVENGVLDASVSPYPYTADNKPIELTRLDMTLDFPQKRMYVRAPRFDESTLELTSLYKDRLDSTLSSIESIINVEKVIKVFTDVFGNILSNDSLYEQLGNLRKSRELSREETFWGIGLKEGKNCSVVTSYYDINGFELRVKIFADENADVIGFNSRFNTGKNRLEVVYDLQSDQKQADETIKFDSVYEASLDGIKLFNGTFRGKDENGTGVSEIEVEPGKLLKSFLGETDISQKIKVSAKSGSDLKIETDVSTGKGATSHAEIVMRELTESKPDTLGTGEVIDISKLSIKDYGDAGQLAEFIVEKTEALDIQQLRDYIDAYIKKYVNAAASYDLIKEFWKSGMLSTVISVLSGEKTANEIGPTEMREEGVSGEKEAEEKTQQSPSEGTGQSEENSEAKDAPEGTGQSEENSEAKDAPEGAGQSEGNGEAKDVPEGAGQSEGNGEAKDAPEGAGQSEGNEGAPKAAYEKQDEGKSQREPGEEEKEKLRAEFLKQYKYTYPIETDDPKADWGDEIVMDIVPILMGVPYEEAGYKDAYAYLGEQWYGEGLDEKVIGASIGDVFEIEATLGDDFGAFSGYRGKFRVTVTDIHKYVRPEWTESFIVDRLGYESLDACEKKLIDKLD